MQIGISIAQTGALSIMGMQALNGIRLWVLHLERKGGLRVGRQLRPVRLITRDDHSRTSLVRDNIKALIRQEGVDVLLGPYSSHLTKAAADICEVHQTLLWNHGGASDEICQPKSNWIVSTLSPASQYLQKLPQWIDANGSAVHQYLLLSSRKGTFAGNVAAGLRESIGVFTKAARLHSAELPESTNVFIQLLNETAPTALVLIGTFEQETGLFKTRGAWPESIRYVACVSAGISQFLDSVGDLSEGIIGPSQWEPGIDRATLIGPTSREFVRDFAKSFREMPNYVAAGAFAAGLIIEECIPRAGSLEGTKVREVAHELQTETFYGRFQIDGSGRQVGHAMHLVRWENGKKIVLPA